MGQPFRSGIEFVDVYVVETELARFLDDEVEGLAGTPAALAALPAVAAASVVALVAGAGTGRNG